MKLLVAGFAALFSLVLGVAMIASGPNGDSPPSAVAIAEIPAELLQRYVSAAATCPGLPW